MTLKLPADQLRAVNGAIELHAWSAFQTEFHPTQDFRPIRQEITARATGSPAGS